MMFPSLNVFFFPQIFVYQKGRAGFTSVAFLVNPINFSQLMKYNNLIISESHFIFFFFRVAKPVPEL